MAKYVTHKDSREGRNQTLDRELARAIKRGDRVRGAARRAH